MSAGKKDSKTVSYVAGAFVLFSGTSVGRLRAASLLNMEQNIFQCGMAHKGRVFAPGACFVRYTVRWMVLGAPKHNNQRTGVVSSLQVANTWKGYIQARKHASNGGGAITPICSGHLDDIPSLVGRVVCSGEVNFSDVRRGSIEHDVGVEG